MRELDYEKIGMRIRQVRKAKGWSQDELAKKCGICMSFLGHIERGSRVMSMDTFASICEALDVGADELLWGAVHASSAAVDIWNISDKRVDGKQRRQVKSGQGDHYSMYIRIMKSVAEIMKEAD